MAEQYIYAVTRVRSRELSLLSESVIAQLCAASGVEDCLRILSERGWGNPEGRMACPGPHPSEKKEPV